MGNTPNAGYWLIVLNLQREEGLQPLTDEIDEAVLSWKEQNPGQTIEDHLYELISSVKLPLLTSAIQETLRYTTSVTPFRRVTEPAELGGFHFNKGDEIVCVTRSIHFDEEIHENAREYDPRRYMGEKKFSKDGKIVANHSMPWGGGVSMCEGRFVDLLAFSPYPLIFWLTGSILLLQAFREWGTQSVYGLPSHAVHGRDRSNICRASDVRGGTDWCWRHGSQRRPPGYHPCAQVTPRLYVIFSGGRTVPLSTSGSPAWQSRAGCDVFFSSMNLFINVNNLLLSYTRSS
jgi:hypothetical protein